MTAFVLFYPFTALASTAFAGAAIAFSYHFDGTPDSCTKEDKDDYCCKVHIT